MGDRLHEGRPLARLLASLEPVSNGRPDLACLRKMVSNNFRSTFGYVYELCCQRFCDPFMERLAFTTQHAGISCILHQRVLEHVNLNCAVLTSKNQTRLLQAID